MDIVSVFVFVFGAIIGSFLNVCIVRLAQEKSVVFPASHCPQCQAPIQWYDNIPLISWFALGGKCRSCKKSISFRYWFVEFLTACSFLGFYWYFGMQAVLLPYLFMLGCFIVATFVDFEHRIIPDEVSVGGMFAGIAFSALIPSMHPISVNGVILSAFIAGTIVVLCLGLTLIYPIFCKHLMEEEDPKGDAAVKALVFCSLTTVTVICIGADRLPPSITPFLYSLSAAITGYIIGGGLIYAMGLAGDIMFRKESMGGGDVKLMAMVGAFLGWKLAILAFFIAPFFGAVFGIIEKIRTKDSTIAYGPFLVLGSLVSLFWGEQIIRWILNGGMYGG